jgi:hypothetical protein
MSNAFSALIWWVVPALGLIGALGYVTWVSKCQGKFQQETQRSVGQFQRFQDSLRVSQARDVAADNDAEDLKHDEQLFLNTEVKTNVDSNFPTQKRTHTEVIRPDAN